MGVLPALALAAFLSGAALMAGSYFLGGKALRRLIRLATRVRTFYIVAGGDASERVAAAFLACGMPVRALKAFPAGDSASSLLRVRARLATFNRAKTADTLTRLHTGVWAVAGVRDFYME